ncbi:heavy metal-associated isoprenylated plant protein 30-like [Cicer arietinum]|uniref:Copper transport protein CCH-like n=1 Tax=Cicer arietinum TaxID=3827 RepID=A0A1S2XKA1_CICAR|nr:copper transport protein CCH-like [Cicer arietinum]
MSSETVVLKVKMSCQGCAGAVNRVLAKMEGVESFGIDLKEQKVTVKGNVKPQEVYETVSKSGKKTEFWVDPENKSTEIATEVGSENKPSEAATVVSAELDNKPLEVAATIASVEEDNQSSKNVTVISAESDNVVV